MHDPSRPPPSLYDRLGGEVGLRALTLEFYRMMDSLPEAAGIRALHPQSTESSEEKLYLFLSGWMGGPSLYLPRYGHPRLRMRHSAYAIGESERDQWMLCFQQAMKNLGVEKPLSDELMTAFYRMADHLRNQDSPRLS